MNYKSILSRKYSTLISIINDKQDAYFVRELDALLLKKRFDNAYELSLTENIIHVSSHNLTNTTIKKIINDFLKTAAAIPITDNRSLYEIVKISNLTSEKLEKAIDFDMHKKLISVLDNVSHETSLISFDFLILRIYDNMMLKSSVLGIKKEYAKAKHNILKKIINFNYKKETREKETTFLCWADRILCAVINKEISPNDFVVISKKIFGLTIKSVYFYWKVLHSINYILLQQDFSANADLRTFKKEVLKKIDDLYNAVDMNIDEIKELTASTLAKKSPSKEDFYYLFDILKITSQKSEEHKFFCVKLCKYIIKSNHQHNIFCYRFIRKYFIETFFDILKNPISNINIKVEEISSLISLFHIDTYFCFNRAEIFANIVEKLKAVNDGTTKLTYHNFYKFCDSLDYIMSENMDIITPDFLKMFKIKHSEHPKLFKCFQILLEKYGDFC